MSRVVKVLDETERQQMEEQADGIAETPRPQVDISSGREFVFVVHFDGTLNDKDHLKKGERPTNVANLNRLMKPHAKDNENFVSHYEPGVGTQNSRIVGGLKAAIRPSGDMRATAEKAYQKFRKDASEWLDKHPDADPATAVKVMATGFSRGGVTMAMFSQMLYEEGLVDYNDDQKILIPPGTLGLSGGIVYDPVSTGYKGNTAFSPTSRNITEVQARHDYRRPFKDDNHDADPYVSTVEVMGNHCDIGGGYNDQGIWARVLAASAKWFDKSGLSLDTIPDNMRYRDDQPVQVHEERDLPGMEHTRKFSGSKWVIGTAAALAGGGVIKPLEALIPKGISVLAGKADYPRKHDPREGLDVPRQQRSSARHQEQMADGWQRFEGVNGVVWSKDYPESNHRGITRVVMAERNPSGRKNDRIELYLTHANGEVQHQQTPIAGGRKMQRLGAESRRHIDQDLGQPVEQRLARQSLEAREHKADQHLQQKVERQLEQRLEQRLNQSSQEIKTGEPGTAPPVPDTQARSESRQATVAAIPTRVDVTQRKEMAQTFKANPAVALEKYPDNQRISAAKTTLDEVRQRLPGGGVVVKRLHDELVNRLSRGAAIPNPQQAFRMIDRAMGRGGMGG